MTPVTPPTNRRGHDGRAARSRPRRLSAGWGARATFALLAACAGGDLYRRSGGHLAVATVRAQPVKALTGTGEHLLAVADDGARRLLLTDQAAWILRGTAVERTPGTRRWIAAAFIAAPDGRGTWAVGLDAEGRLWRVRPTSELENISDRYGLVRDPIRAVAAADTHTTAFLLTDGLAIADGHRVARYATPGGRALAAGGHEIAVVYPDRVERYTLVEAEAHDQADASVGAARDGARRDNDAKPARTQNDAPKPPRAGGLSPTGAPPLARRSYALAGIVAAALDARGDLFAATATTVYRAAGDGDLRAIYLSDGRLRWLTAAGPRVWFADDQGLLLYDDGPTAIVVSDGIVSPREGGAGPGSPEASPRAAADGSLWLVAGATTTRLVPDRPSTLEARWTETIQPLFARACAECHRDGGKGDLDLSTAAAWQAARDDILDRTVHRRTMPPGGRTLSEDDRNAIAAWARASGG